MKIGMIGAGKLGLPVALAIESKGHDVQVYDVKPAVRDYIQRGVIPYKEEGIEPLLANTKITVADTIEEVIRDKDIVFLAVQTPHQPQYEGVTPLPYARADFDYTYLINAVENVASIAAKRQEKITLAVISTCLPSTFRKKIKPLLNEWVDYVYTPQFIAMGTVVDDYLHPEFNLVGVDSPAAAEKLGNFYTSINSAPTVSTDITTAEGIKVSYNTWITMKTVVANAWGELCEALNMNFDDMYFAWSLSTKRLISSKYMRAGMSDGGGCHPRDNIALSWLAENTQVSHDIWGHMMYARQDHEAWLGRHAAWLADMKGLPLVILGKSFKPETNIQTGSPALLMANQMKHDFIHVGEGEEELLKDVLKVPHAYFIAVQHWAWQDMKFPEGSLIIDPFRYMPDIPGCSVYRIGEWRK